MSHTLSPSRRKGLEARADSKTLRDHRPPLTILTVVLAAWASRFESIVGLEALIKFCLLCLFCRFLEEEDPKLSFKFANVTSKSAPKLSRREGSGGHRYRHRHDHHRHRH